MYRLLVYFQILKASDPLESSSTMIFLKAFAPEEPASELSLCRASPDPPCAAKNLERAAATV